MFIIQYGLSWLGKPFFVAVCLFAALMVYPSQAEDVISSDSHAHHEHMTPHQSSPTLGEKSAIATLYSCPMHPHVISDKPGTCPICGMDLVAQKPQAPHEQSRVQVSAAMQQALGVRTQTVGYSTLWRYIETFGTVELDKAALSHIHARVKGWVENLKVHEVGQSITKGEHLYDLYAPDLVTAQDDYLLALDYVAKEPKRGNELLRKGRLRLELLGMSDQVIDKLQQSRKTMHLVPFYAPRDGVVTALGLRDGMYIEPGVTLIELVDLSSVWVMAHVFENEQSWLQTGRQAEVSATTQGLFKQEAIIDYIYPELDPVTQALKVRIPVSNPDLLLHPGSTVDVAIYGGPKRQRLTIPLEALIQTGRESRVVVQRDDHAFSVHPVRVGMIAQGKAEILSGLEPGDEVVVSGQFLIDSEASLRGVQQQLSSESNPHAGHSHH